MIDQIKQLWDQGYTLTQIARHLKTTRNVIAGRMHRAKLAGVSFDPRTAAIVRRGPSSLQSTNLENQITRLKISECRFILNDDTSKPVYCCEPIDRRSYCKTHADICYMAPEKRRDRRTR